MSNDAATGTTHLRFTITGSANRLCILGIQWPSGYPETPLVCVVENKAALSGGAVKAITGAVEEEAGAWAGMAATFSVVSTVRDRLDELIPATDMMSLWEQVQAAKEAGVVAAAAAVAAAKGGAGGGDGDSEEEEAAVVVEPKRVAPTISAPSVPAATKAQKREWRVRGAVHCTQRSWRAAVAPSLLPHLLWTSLFVPTPVQAKRPSWACIVAKGGWTSLVTCGSVAGTTKGDWRGACPCAPTPPPPLCE